MQHKKEMERESVTTLSINIVSGYHFRIYQFSIESVVLEASHVYVARAR